MISLQEVFYVHSLVIQEFGGSEGLRDRGLLDSALARMGMMFSGQELYPTPASKAGALIQSIIENHPFNDGNKRVGYVLMRLLLRRYDYDLQASEQEKFEFVMSIAAGELEIEDVIAWISKRMIRL